MSDETDERPPLTPEELDYTHLPDQTAYKIRAEDASSFGFEQVETFPLVITNEFKLLYFEIEPPGGIDWHTHVPDLDQVNLCLEGTARYTMEQADGNEQVIDLQPMELIYLPGGARHKIEAIGDQLHKGMTVYKSEPVARLEMLEGYGGYHFEDWPVALWVDRKRNEVVALDEDAVSE